MSLGQVVNVVIVKEEIMIRGNPKQWKNNYALVYGLLRCKSGCGLWNRDVNGAKTFIK